MRPCKIRIKTSHSGAESSAKVEMGKNCDDEVVLFYACYLCVMSSLLSNFIKYLLMYVYVYCSGSDLFFVKSEVLMTLKENHDIHDIYETVNYCINGKWKKHAAE